MKRIDGTPKNVRELFTGVKYTLHYYQREYRWTKQQIEELLEDLTSEFLEFYEPGHPLSKVPEYGHYFLGSVVLTEDENAIIDGQQRLTSLMLLLIYLYHQLEDTEDKAEVLTLFWSKKAGEKTFSINAAERNKCLTALKDNDVTFVPGSEAPESVRNIYARYQELDQIFPEEVKGEALPFFKDWLLDNVDFIRIIAKTEQDAHKIFVSMNDRGLSLTSVEMLKGFLLSEIENDKQRNEANDIWKDTMVSLNDLGKNQDTDFIKNWLRAQYAQTIRESKAGAENKDWDIIGNPFHKWVRENTDKLKLKKSDDFYRFVVKEMVLFANIYKLLLRSSQQFNKDYEYIYYNANRDFTLQYQLILAAIDPNDTWETIERKIKAMSCYVDQYIALRVFSYKKVGYNDRKNAIFAFTLKFRRKPLAELVDLLYDDITGMEFQIDGVQSFSLNQFTGRYMLHNLARLTHYVEEQCGLNTRFEDYVDRTIKNPCDIEHVWANRFDQHKNEFQTKEEFETYRNKFGGLLLLPRDKNRSFQDKTYDEKLKMYYSENMLARSLHPLCYQNNPQFLKFIQRENLSEFFQAKNTFDKNTFIERQKLYQALAARIWNPERIRGVVS